MTTKTKLLSLLKNRNLWICNAAMVLSAIAYSFIKWMLAMYTFAIPAAGIWTEPGMPPSIAKAFMVMLFIFPILFGYFADTIDGGLKIKKFTINEKRIVTAGFAIAVIGLILAYVLINSIAYLCIALLLTSMGFGMVYTNLIAYTATQCKEENIMPAFYIQNILVEVIMAVASYITLKVQTKTLDGGFDYALLLNCKWIFLVAGGAMLIAGIIWVANRKEILFKKEREDKANKAAERFFKLSNEEKTSLIKCIIVVAGAFICWMMVSTAKYFYAVYYSTPMGQIGPHIVVSKIGKLGSIYTYQIVLAVIAAIVLVALLLKLGERKEEFKMMCCGGAVALMLLIMFAVSFTIRITIWFPIIYMLISALITAVLYPVTCSFITKNAPRKYYATACAFLPATMICGNAFGGYIASHFVTDTGTVPLIVYAVATALLTAAAAFLYIKKSKESKEISKDKVAATEPTVK